MNRRVAAVLVGGLLGILCMAPTPGDIGGCGTTIEYLNVDNYAFARKSQDCERCNDCGLDTARCVHACDPKIDPEVSVPATCKPLEHDGEVCLRALHAASCSTYATYVADTNASTPSECDFCKFDNSTPTPSFVIDASATIDASND